jgi:hypothetical protein
MERFNLKKLNKAKGKEKSQISLQLWKIWMQKWKLIAKESPGYFELKKHRPWFDEGCSKLLDQRKQAKFQ